MIPTRSQIRELSDKELERIKKYVDKEYGLRRTLKKKGLPLPQIGVGGRKRRFNLYVLVCTGGKYYVGITAQKVSERFQQHVDGKGAKWTRKYKPTGILEQHSIGFMSESEATKHESSKTHDMIAIYGAENVRGGDLCYVDQKTFDKKIERSAKKLLKIKESAILEREQIETRYQEQLASELLGKI